MLLVGLSRGASAAEPDGVDGVPLFDGKTLEGWEVLEDKGNFFVEDGEIVGETAAGVKGSYLCTKESYDNFALELEFKVDEGLNSGVQIRTDVHKEDTTTLYMSGRLELKSRSFTAGQVFGYHLYTCSGSDPIGAEYAQPAAGLACSQPVSGHLRKNLDNGISRFRQCCE